MRVSNFPLSTLKEVPADAEIISHQLMLRAGMIRKLASGMYSWLPLGLRTLRKVEAIIREEMNQAGALELLMPSVQPAELWQESKRWEQYGPELLRFNDRHQREFCYGPTHEEVITDIARREIRSYKQLPVNYYQIQTKFRDEIRPRFGVMRAREFIMKDAYSFHESQQCLENTYQCMHQAYTKIFNRLGLEFRAVEADSGSIGGNSSHEFHVLAKSGEDAIAFSDASNYAANVELAPIAYQENTNLGEKLSSEKVATPTQKTIDEVSQALAVETKQCIKMLIVKSEDNGVIALAIRGDHELNPVKVEKIDGVFSPLTFASNEEIENSTNSVPGFIGPIDLNCRVIVDHAAAILENFVCGANEAGFHIKNANWPQKTALEHADLRNIQQGDPSPDGNGSIQIKRGIEVGHIFQLGDKYSRELNASVLDQNGKEKIMTMGCYGIGVSRIVAATIEQNYDDHGIIWPLSLAPFQLSLIPINMSKSETVKSYCEDIYQRLSKKGIEVLFDDRNLRPGMMFADHELIGIPHRLVVSERGLKAGRLEYKYRTDKDSKDIEVSDVETFLVKLITSNFVG
ncbi:MAG: proline--tRNA ligase [Gammaproteobacteria bacterium]|nr:proline--tRNA ligase [Gammaproteobacteria bacterium]